jgi:glycosyltransferase involved in cell wall biosynthesis
VKWLADFRDPWTSIGYHKQLKLTTRSQQNHKKLESEVLNTADKVIVTSFTTKKEFESITNKPIEVITNGYDKHDIGHVDLDIKFTMSHIGSLLSKRNPEVLWQVLKDLVQEHHGFSNNFQLNLVGTVSDEVLESIAYNNLSDYINNVGYLSHKESVTIQKKSQILLLIEIDSDETKGIIPGKLFEYMASNRPIIAIGPNASDVEVIIKDTNTGKYFSYNDYDALKSTILNYFSAYKKGELQSHPIGLQKYSRRNLTKTLANLI